MRKRKRAHTEVRADEYNSSIAATPGRTKKRDLSPDSDIDSSTDFSEPESRVSSDRGSDQAGEDEQDVTPQHEDNDSASDDQAPATAKKKRRNVYEGMYDKAMAEVRFLKRLLEKGVGLSQKDVDACRQRVDNGTTYKRAIAHVFPPTHQNTQRRKNSAA
ncbi:hypothetical protein A1O3_08344 [Capronia epimyces CBS 606.96]|uniref:Uncharacterized protein n=1 Tax=Capronia epimyces CBS 606.96 TaxID=1182542 RepID=W9XIL7_9EURO|nr:uncharacterized protein A1O3_08344 [Capronia epimyces CBS 606.96]EXJ80058.1 hypothetical protein A1O3_08344 [Capronia epimyces CBS 606.96]